MAIWMNDSDDDVLVGGLTVRSGETIDDRADDRAGVAEVVKERRLKPWYEVRIFDPGSLSSKSLNQADYLFRSLQSGGDPIRTSLGGGPEFLLRRDGFVWIRGELRSWSVVTGELTLMIPRIPLKVVKDRYGLFTELKRRAREEAREKKTDDIVEAFYASEYAKLGQRTMTAEEAARVRGYTDSMSLQDKYFGIYQPITPPPGGGRREAERQGIGRQEPRRPRPDRTLPLPRLTPPWCLSYHDVNIGIDPSRDRM